MFVVESLTFSISSVDFLMNMLEFVCKYFIVIVMCVKFWCWNSKTRIMVGLRARLIGEMKKKLKIVGEADLTYSPRVSL